MSKENTDKEIDPIDAVDASKQTGLGAHIWKVDGYGNHANIAVEHYMSQMPRMGAWQIFSHGPHSRKVVNQDDPNALYKLAKKIPLFVHSTYRTSPKGNGTTAMEHIVEQIFMARAYGAQGVILHIPKDSISEIIRMTTAMVNAIKDDEYFSTIIAKNKGKINKTNGIIPIIPRIIWEAKALKKSPESFETPEKWNTFATALKENDLNPDIIGLNIDTAHIYASGAKITTAEEAEAWLSGLSPLTMKYMKSGVLHLNGNHYHQDVKAGDKHMVPGSNETPDLDDKIWKNEPDITKSGCSEFIKWARHFGIPIILELKHDVLGLDKIAEFATKFD
jgi:endonuclease IV